MSHRNAFTRVLNLLTNNCLRSESTAISLLSLTSPTSFSSRFFYILCFASLVSSLAVWFNMFSLCCSLRKQLYFTVQLYFHYSFEVLGVNMMLIWKYKKFHSLLAQILLLTLHIFTSEGFGKLYKSKPKATSLCIRRVSRDIFSKLLKSKLLLKTLIFIFSQFCPSLSQNPKTDDEES